MTLEGGVVALARRATTCETIAQLQFLLLNDSRQVFDYRQATLWTREGGVENLSGVVEIDRNAPLVQFLDTLANQLSLLAEIPCNCVPDMVSPATAAQWLEMLPENVLWVPFKRSGSAEVLLLLRDRKFTEVEIRAVSDWVALWASAAEALSWRTRRKWWGKGLAGPAKNGSRLRKKVALTALCAATLIPVPLTLLAPGELVPARAEIVRAPLDGVLGEIFVQPNQKIRQGEALFQYDQAALLSRLEISRQELTTARAEYRQAAQRALQDAAAKAMLSPLSGKLEQLDIEVAFLEREVQRSIVHAHADGIVLIDDPADWIGKPVVIGEKILRLAKPDDLEIEAWISIGDAIPLPESSVLTFYPVATPMHPVKAHLRFYSHEAQERADLTYAYRVRAIPAESSIPHRLGTKGTVRIRSRSVPLIYWLLRRPLAHLRAYLDW